MEKLEAKLESNQSRARRRSEDPIPMDVASDIRGDLEYLRKGSGFSHMRLRKREALVRILGGANEPDAVLEERLRSAIESLEYADGKPVDDAKLLFEVFGLCETTAEKQTLTERRGVAGERLKIGVDAVADREKNPLDRLRNQLITGWYPKSPVPIPTAMPHGGAVLCAAGTRVVLQNGHLVENLHRNEYLATFDGAEYLQVDTTTDEPVTVVLGDYRIEEEQMRGGRRLRFFPPAPMRRGETYELTYRIAPARGASDEHVVVGSYLAFHEPTRSATFEAEFRGLIPKWIWWFTGLTHLEAPGQPFRQRLLTPNHQKRVIRQFTDLHGGLYSGLAWEWEFPHHIDQ